MGTGGGNRIGATSGAFRFRVLLQFPEGCSSDNDANVRKPREKGAFLSSSVRMMLSPKCWSSPLHHCFDWWGRVHEQMHQLGLLGDASLYVDMLQMGFGGGLANAQNLGRFLDGKPGRHRQ